MDVSIVVPLHNEAASVTTLMTSLANQVSQPREVVIVDAGSTDRTTDLVEAFRSPFPLHLVRAARLNPGEARNEGVRQATSDWIAFTDGGIRLEPDWLYWLMNKALATGVGIVFGTYEPVCDTRFRKWAALAYVPARGPEGIRGPFVASMILRRQVFDAVGGFPSYRAAEDLIFIEKLATSGHAVAFAPEAVVHWETPPDLASTFRRFVLYSEINLRAGRGRFWHAGVAKLYLLLLGSMLLGYWGGAGAFVWILLPFFFLARAIKAGWQKLRFLPFSARDPVLFVGAALILVATDIATFTGGLRWLFPSRKGTS